MSNLKRFIILFFSFIVFLFFACKKNNSNSNASDKGLNETNEKDSFEVVQKSSDENWLNSDTIINYNLGNSLVKIVIHLDSGSQKYILLNLHENEATSISAAKEILRRYGGKFLYLNQNGERNLTFRLNGKVYFVDPNRIFTRDGIRKSLNNLGDYSYEAEEVVNKLAQFLLKELNKDSLVIVAVHNNSDGSYSAKSYLGGYKQDAKEIYINNKEDEDDFFFVTRVEHYQYLKSKGFNVILQDNENVRDDGSLSVYCGKNNLPYINVETQQGKFQKQIQMLEAINEYFNK